MTGLAPESYALPKCPSKLRKDIAEFLRGTRRPKRLASPRVEAVFHSYHVLSSRNPSAECQASQALPDEHKKWIDVANPCRAI